MNLKTITVGSNTYEVGDAMLDDLADYGGAAMIGFTPLQRMAVETVQEAIANLNTRLMALES